MLLVKEFGHFPLKLTMIDDKKTLYTPIEDMFRLLDPVESEAYSKLYHRILDGVMCYPSPHAELVKGSVISLQDYANLLIAFKDRLHSPLANRILSTIQSTDQPEKGDPWLDAFYLTLFTHQEFVHIHFIYSKQILGQTNAYELLSKSTKLLFKEVTGSDLDDTLSGSFREHLSTPEHLYMVGYFQEVAVDIAMQDLLNPYEATKLAIQSTKPKHH